MKFLPTEVGDVHVVELEPRTDDRGFFSRTFCRHEFEELGLEPVTAQANMSYNRRAGTLRGMHYQTPPAAEAKLVRCTRGAIFDVIVDVDPASATYLQHVGVELTADNRRALYVPPMFAHGFLTLEDDTEVTYQVSEFYAPDHERGARHDDPAFGIDWPAPVHVISDKDASWPSFPTAETS